MASVNERIIEAVFHRYYEEGSWSVPFDRDDLVVAAEGLGLARPKNLGAVVYHMRYSLPMPESVRMQAPPGMEWIIRGKGRARYAFEPVERAWFAADMSLPAVEVPSGAPRVVTEYQSDDEQALLARLRHSQVIALATGLVVHHLQPHVRSQLPTGQVEIDDLFVGTDVDGINHMLPVEAKGPGGNISLIQVEQGADYCLHKHPEDPCVPLGAKAEADGSLFVFVFEVLPAGTPPGSGVSLQRQVRFSLAR